MIQTDEEYRNRIRPRCPIVGCPYQHTTNRAHLHRIKTDIMEDCYSVVDHITCIMKSEGQKDNGCPDYIRILLIH